MKITEFLELSTASLPNFAKIKGTNNMFPLEQLKESELKQFCKMWTDAMIKKFKARKRS